LSKNRCKLLFSIEKSGAGAYRYGFNGKENDNEVKGEGNQQDYGMRIYDPRVGRFLSVDPLSHYYPELTPYQFSSNSPIKNIDLDGAEAMPDDLLRRAINSGVSALKSYTTTKVEQLTKEVANAGMQYGVNKVDKAAANKLVNYAKDIDARVGSYSEDQKQKIFKTNAEQTKAVLLYEFAKGEGQTNREFDYNSPITKEIASGYVLKDIKSGINDFAKILLMKILKGPMVFLFQFLLVHRLHLAHGVRPCTGILRLISLNFLWEAQSLKLHRLQKTDLPMLLSQTKQVEVH